MNGRLVRTAIAHCAARAAHEANRAWCIAHDDVSQPPWEDAPDWQRDSAIKGVCGVLAGNTPREIHASWWAEKEATGWRYGPVKDPDAKTHPCLVSYDELPPEQKAKDSIFVSVVRAFLEAYEVPDLPWKQPRIRPPLPLVIDDE